MKKRHFSVFQRLSAFVLVSLLAFSSIPVAFAAEVPSSETSSINLEELVDGSGISREEALAFLGVTEEEYGDAPIYIGTQTIDLAQARASLVFNSGDVYELDPITFTNSATGSTMMAFNATKAKYAVVWKWLSPSTDRACAVLTTKLRSTSISDPYPVDAQTISMSGYGSSSPVSIQTDWFPVSSSCSYYLQYSTYYSYQVEQFGPIKIQAIVIVGAV